MKTIQSRYHDLLLRRKRAAICKVCFATVPEQQDDTDHDRHVCQPQNRPHIQSQANATPNRGAIRIPRPEPVR